MKQLKLKFFHLVPLMLIALALMGCARTRPEQEVAAPPTSGGVSETAASQVTVATPTQSLVPATLEANPTTLAIEPTATSGEISGAAPTPTATPPISAPATPPPSIPPPPTSTPLPITPPSGSEGIHIVQPGENLFRIALRYGLAADTVARYNNIPNPNRIYVGQKIRIPGYGPGPAPGPGPGTGGQAYVVQAGDTLASIARRFGTTTEALLHANNLSDPNLIYVGQSLNVP